MIPEIAWTLLDDKPLFFRTSTNDAILCRWNGILMTKTYALIIQSMTWNKTFPSDSVKQAAWKEFTKLYGLGVFLGADWDDYISNNDFNSHHTFLITQMCKEQHDFLNKLSVKYTPQQALSWFMSARTVTINAPTMKHEPAF